MFKLIAGSSSRLIAKKMAMLLNMSVSYCNTSRFNDKEISVAMDTDVVHQDVCIIQSTSSPANDTLMELLLIADAVKRSGARSITAVIPYYGYGRQDLKMNVNGSVSAGCVAVLLESMGIEQVITVDLHSRHIEDFFVVPVVNISPLRKFADIISQERSANSVVVSPDAGGVWRAKKISSYLNLPFVIINKKRISAGECQVEGIVGDVKGKNCYIIDDIVDTAGTVCQATDILLANGAYEVHAYITHGVLSVGACEKINNSHLKSLYISDTIDNAWLYAGDKIKILSIVSLLTEQLQKLDIDNV